MTRYKKELKKHGYLTSNDYPWLPYDIGGDVCIEDSFINFNGEYFVQVVYYNVLFLTNYIDRNYKIVRQDY